jgi:hypothetical protein
MRKEQVARRHRTPVLTGPEAGPATLWAALAERALDGPWQRSSLAERFGEVLADPGTAELLAAAVLDHLPRRPWTDPGRLAGELAGVSEVVAALARRPARHVLTGPGEAPAWRWPVPPWTTPGELARALDLTESELSWFADPRGWLRRASDPLRHYRYRWVATRGGVPRLLEAPKPLLAERQRRLLRHLLEAIPPHPAAHGFVPGRSVVSFARPHAGRPVVVRMDLEGFFSSVGAGRVAGLLRTAGYPPPVARLLTGLLVTATPASVLLRAPEAAGPAQVEPRRRLLGRLAVPHLPQGAPSSPAVANLIGYGLDRRLAALARRGGLTYTRYADDLALSGPPGPATAVTRAVERIAGAEGFRVRPDKTRVMPAHRRQRLTGLVVNVAPAVARDEYDALRALLHNCARTGPDEQNRDDHPDFAAHLGGRISWVGATHPRRAATLHALFAAIRWPDAGSPSSPTRPPRPPSTR